MSVNKIIIGSSYSKTINVSYKKLLNNGVTSGIPHYLIKESGKIEKIISEDLISKFTNTKFDQSSISILLENSGYLTYNYLDNKYYDVFGTIYNNKVVEQLWRNKKFWAPYSDNQIKVLKDLCLEICQKYDIVPDIVPNNTINKENITKTIICRSNISPMYLDLNPTFDFNKLKEIKYEYESR